MGDEGLTAPVQPVGWGGGPGPVAAGLILVAAVALLAWHPWSGDAPASDATETRAGTTGAGSTAHPTFGPDLDALADLSDAPTTGPWTGWVGAEWSIVAFLRDDAVSRDPLVLRQQQVAVFVGLQEPPVETSAICDRPGTFLHAGAADLPSGAVRVLGIAFPADRELTVNRVVRIGASLAVRPIALGRVPGAPLTESAAPAGLTPGPSASASAREPVRLFVVAGGGPWPDGVYRFEVASRDGLPGDLFACIRP